MIDITSAKNRILQMAICGELNRRSGTKQDVETILNNVAIERSELLKHQETKKAKKAPMIEEGLFEIPESWVWVPLGELCVFLSRGKSRPIVESS